MSEVVDRTNDALQNGEELLVDISASMIEGSTLTAYCAAHGLKYKIVLRWLNDDDDRQQRYKTALELREHHAKDLIISELMAYLSAKVVDAFVRGEDGSQRLKFVEDWPAELQRLVAAIEYEEIFEMQGTGKERERVHVGRMHKVKFYDKPRSIETFMKHLAMLIDRTQVTGQLTLADLIGGAVKEKGS
jgi:predicted transcriptional regulator